MTLAERDAIDQLIESVWGKRAGIDAVGSHLEKAYGIGVTAVTALDNGVLRVDRADGPPWIARLFSSLRPPEGAEGDALVLRHLEAHDVPAERLADDAPVTTYEGQSLLVTRFVEGEIADATVETVRGIGDVLGRINAVPVPDGALPAGSLHIHSSRNGTLADELAAARSWIEAIEPQLEPQLRDVAGTLRAHLDAADDGSGLPVAVVHPDPVRRNFIASPDGSLVPIDWTGAGVGPRVVPLAFLLMIPVVRGNPENLRALAAGYSSHLRLEAEELESLGAIVSARQVVGACSNLALGTRTGRGTNLAADWKPVVDTGYTEAVRSAFSSS